MSRKTLLTESEIRKFLRLANLGAVGDAKIQEMYGMPGDRDEEEDMMEDTKEGTDVVEEVFARVIQRLTKETKSDKE